MQLGNAVTLHNDTFNMIELQTLLHYIVFSAATIIVSAVGDLVCAHNSLARFPWLRAASDNATHGLVAAFCWIMVSGRPISAESLRDTLLCALVACALDIDHFIAAASFQIRVRFIYEILAAANQMYSFPGCHQLGIQALSPLYLRCNVLHIPRYGSFETGRAPPNTKTDGNR